MSENSNQNLLEVTGLKKYFNINVGMFKSKPLKAVDDVSFSIKKGETLGLVGESGCGKTTVGRTLLHLYKPTAGKIIFNENIPQDIRLVDRSKEGPLTLEIGMSFVADKKGLGKIFDNCIKEHGTTVTAGVLDHIKSLGYKFSTRGALTISVSDIIIPSSFAF